MLLKQLYKYLFFLILLINLLQFSNNVKAKSLNFYKYKISVEQNDSLKAITFYNSAKLEYNKKDYDKSLFYSEQSLQFAINSENSALTAQIHILTAHIYNRKNQINNALMHYLKAANKLEKLKSREILSIIYFEIGILYIESSANEKAIEYLEKSYNINNIDSIISQKTFDIEISSYIFNIIPQHIYKTKKLSAEQLKYLTLELLGSTYFEIGDYQKSLNTFQNLLNYYIAQNNIQGQLLSRNNIAKNLNMLNKYEEAIKQYEEIYTIYKKESNIIGIASTMNNIGYSYVYLKDYKNAIQAFKTTLSADNQTKISDDLKVKTLTNIAICYQNSTDYDKATKYILQAIEIRNNQNNFKESARLNHLLALVYFYNDDLHNAELYCISSISDAKNVQAIDILQQAYYTYSEILQLGNEYEKALDYYQKHLNIRDSILVETRLKEQALSQIQFEAEKTEKKLKLSLADEEVKDLALKQLKLEAEKREKEVTLLRREKELQEATLRQQQLEKDKALQELEITKQRHEAEKRENQLKTLQHEKEIQDFELKQQELEKKEKEKTIALLERESEVKQLEIDKQNEVRRHMRWLGILFSIIFILIVLGLIITKNKNKILSRQKEEISEKNIDLENKNEEINTQKESLQEANTSILEQNEEITKQKEDIEEKNKSITSSINYASRIQTAILPTDEMISQSMGEHFVLFKPRDIVSGDFYWLRQIEDKIIITAADCTGHGVPGAFMSMLGISFLNDIVTNEQISTANNILNELRKRVKSSLKQTGKLREAKDGMDMALCIIDINTLKLQFAGANNPLIIIRDNELIQIKADRMPIGIYIKEKESFTNREFDLRENDCLYMFSDGFADQFGGDDGRKFNSKYFKELLLKIHHNPMHEQKTILSNTIEEWRGDRIQVDDILVVGLKIQGTYGDIELL